MEDDTRLCNNIYCLVTDGS